MEDQELRTRLDGLEHAVARVEGATREATSVLTGMRVGDADARSDVKIALAELRTSATAMRDTALSLQQASKVAAPTWKWMAMGFGLALVAVVLALGGKAILPQLFKAFGV